MPENKFGNSSGSSTGKANLEMKIKYYVINKNDLKEQLEFLQAKFSIFNLDDCPLLALGELD